MDDLVGALSKLKSKWMIGGTALEQGPSSWKVKLRQLEKPELGLLAIAAQAGQVALQPAPQGELQACRPLPCLSLPPLPDTYRSRFRSLWAAQKPDASEKAAVLQLMAARGYTVHPADWMPDSFMRLPVCYTLWADWAEEQERDLDEKLTAETWEDFSQAARVQSLHAMRVRDASEARELLASKMDQLPAAQRLQLLHVLETSLSDEDQEFLEHLQGNDRSGKVQQFAQDLLARLGLRTGDQSDLEELADFHRIERQGILKRRQVLSPNKLKNNAQRERRAALYDQINLVSFAARFELSVEQLIDSWAFGDEQADRGFCGMVARTAADKTVLQCVDRVLAQETLSEVVLQSLLGRLSAQSRAEKLPQVMQHADSSCDVVITCLGDDLGTVQTKLVQGSPLLQSMLEQVRERVESDASTIINTMLTRKLFQLGLIVSADTAKILIEEFVEAGIMKMDNALAMLHFNATLLPRE
ncbi:hypothetical protein SAMN05444141_102117 [Pseudovibrio denitrificans]|uniref:Uncharacterized protein n=1 Tax=Pseudovibrio denitrificans TaxID=258256 RepID=A0A1I6Z6W4_9HYPH|nr:DUF5691 domain-containing protein [Pseudovibrio denitrificans]SFT58452.1 hypothetical protein SAMN05444141_102117 [Pseudovibrio denitrificans]